MSIKSMNVTELKEKLDQVTLVDVREQHEWDAGHIKEAQFLALSELEEKFSEIPQDKPVVLQCRSGKRSYKAAEFLAEKGYTDLTNLEGGILAWEEEGFDIES